MKICGLTRPEDVDAVVEAGADAIGFVFYPPSARYVTPQRAAELAARLPAFVTPVLLFVNTPADDVIAAASAIPGALLQFHGDETPEECWASSRQGHSAFLRAARIPLDPDGPPFDLIGFSKRFDRAKAILLDAHVPGYGGGGRTFDWSLLPAAPDAHLVLSGGLTPDNVADGIAALRPLCRTLAVDVSSGVEASKGIKDHGKVRAFIEAVRG
ncbi:phosphoribosylanthranilate isomerase [Kutzneria buriramensis]|uniref:N-(5'-phosphoribosyl)anthranilate isomerase n=1 Tax=Kutzneria buriramensis TaxID=1045776 RepID=A0A3E0H236_9PSEU|nr:phosphoribosylanthranilate isomerase [Kutzneria buriramensis]